MATEKRIRIWQEDTPLNPRKDWDNLCTMVCSHKRYDLGDEEFRPEYANNWREHMAEYFADKAGVEIEYDNYEELVDRIWEWIEENVVYSNLYLYDHSGISISSGPFNCGWDSGQVGFIFCTIEEARKNWMLTEDANFDSSTIEEWDGPDKGQQVSLRKVVERMMEGEVEEYDQYLRGDVYGFTIEERNPEVGVGWEDVDSCGGFFGDDFRENGMLDYIDPELHHLLDDVKIEY